MTSSADVGGRIEAALERAVGRAGGPAAPPRIAAAMQDAVFPGGARVRPRLCLGVAAACGARRAEIVDSAAVAIELLHCASLVHDDMACFDDAETRRGRPAIHRAYGEDLALLTGDALIVLAFETLGRTASKAPDVAGDLITIVARSVGAPHGIIAGQAWECEPAIPSLAAYHRAKTAALFVAAASAGAAAAGADASLWAPLGDKLGEAYQVADDLRDAAGEADEIGKPVGQDAVHARPNAVATLGVDGALRRLRTLVEAAAAAVPDCGGKGALEALIRAEETRLVPKKLAHHLV
ncbi:MAG: polyprenyl synthetase family protein [Pseudomonadota bacterium]